MARPLVRHTDEGFPSPVPKRALSRQSVHDWPRVRDVDDRHGRGDAFFPVDRLSEYPGSVQAPNGGDDGALNSQATGRALAMPARAPVTKGDLTVHADLHRVVLSHSAQWGSKGLMWFTRLQDLTAGREG
jgi:hypothetical protein